MREKELSEREEKQNRKRNVTEKVREEKENKKIKLREKKKNMRKWREC